MAETIESVRTILLAPAEYNNFTAGFFERPLDAGRGGQWECPGGKIDDGETLHEAAAREVHEETGFDDIEFLTRRGLELAPRPIPDGPHEGKLISVTGLVAVIRGPRKHSNLTEHAQELWQRPRRTLRSSLPLTTETRQLLIGFRHLF